MAVNPTPTNLATTYNTFNYVGCYLDGNGYAPDNFRTLNGGTTPADYNQVTFDVQVCIDVCRGKGFKYAGMEYGVEVGSHKHDQST